ncbi:MAG: SLC13 family permease [Deltaproteobacteria bacterium]|nr:SLC13 family permease [Deltaproteobacteria bacterium]MBW2072570.1 SLC13 family permease [Deltaproteobacteria bacterium]
MSFDAYLTIAILAVTFAFLIKTRLPPAAIFLGALTLTITFRLAPLEQSLKGFSNAGMLTIGALFMVAAGMYSTGAITMITEKLIGRPRTLAGAQLKILPPVAVGSAFLNNTPLVAMMIPVIRDLAKTCRLSASRLYIPLSYASILGGTCTLIGTATNLVVAGMIVDAIAQNDPGLPIMRELGIFDPAWIGVPATVAGLAFIMVFSRWLLPAQAEKKDADTERRSFGAEFVVEAEGPLVGKTLEAVGFFNQRGFQLLGLKCLDGSEPAITADTRLRAGDELIFSAEIDYLPQIWGTSGLRPLITGHEMETERYTHGLVEVVVSHRSRAVGRKIRELPLPESPYRMKLVAVSRHGRPIEGRLRDVRIKAGDIAVLEVDDSFYYENRNEIEFALSKRLSGARIQRTDRAVAAGLITIGMVAVVAVGMMSMLNAALLASGLMVLTGCMSLETAGRSIEFSTLVVIASAIGLEAAVTHSGLAASIAEVLSGIGGGSPQVALAVIFLGCIAMDTIITNVASAVFMFPIALGMAADLGVSFTPFAMTVLVGASCSFISPMGYQTNLMVYRPGGYSFGDYVKIGVPLTVIVGIITIVLVPLVFKF